MACQYAERPSTVFNLPSYDQPMYDIEGDGLLHRHPGKRPRYHINIEDHEENETLALRYIALFAKWAQGLRQAHQNCGNIPVSLVLQMGIRMIRHLVLKRGLKMRIETLATTFWVALKFYSSRDTIPNASFMSMVTNVPKQALLNNEPKILSHLEVYHSLTF